MGSLQPQDYVDYVEVPIADATRICCAALEKAGFTAEDAATITDHLVDAEMRGSPMAGLARALTVIEALSTGRKVQPSTVIETVTEGLAYSRLTGHDALGYLVAYKATEVAIKKAKTSGVAVVGADDFWYSGNLAYFAEMCTKQDLMCFIISNASCLVAPHGAVEGRFGTNPVALGFPTSNKQRPVIWDIGTSNIMHAQIKRADRLGINLPEGAAYDKDGNPSKLSLFHVSRTMLMNLAVDPRAALEGTMTAWGAHKGSGLATMVQLMGMAAGSAAVPEHLAGFGFLIVAINPGIFRPIEEVLKEADEYSDYVRSAKQVKGSQTAVRMPFDRSYENRKAALERGTVKIPSIIVEQLGRIAA